MMARRFVHVLTSVDEASRRGVCRACGPVDVKGRGGGRWRCAAGVREYRRRQRQDARVRRLGGTRMWTPCCRVGLLVGDWPGALEPVICPRCCVRYLVFHEVRTDWGGSPEVRALWGVHMQRYDEYGDLLQFGDQLLR